jgi:mono/diheme cytochrome c family protein
MRATVTRRFSASYRRRLLLVACVALLAWAPAGCRQDMHDQPKYQALEASAFFPDGRASRPRVEGTVAREELVGDPQLFTGRSGTRFVSAVPMKVNAALLERGRERFNIYCTPCHDRTGSGNGMVVQRGYPAPRSFHEERLRDIPIGYFFDVATNGFGRMPSYAGQVPPADRWAIAAYIRALQLSQHAKLDDAPAAERRKLEQGGRGGEQ